MNPTVPSLARRPIASIVASLALASFALADTAQLVIELDKTMVEASTSELFKLTVRGEPGHLAILLMSNRRGSTPLPGVGNVEIPATPKPFVMSLGKIPASGKRSITAALDCDNPLITDGPVFFQVVTFDPGMMAFDQISNLVFFQVLSGDCGMCAQEAEADAFGTTGTAGHALWLPGIGTDFAFVGGGQFTEREDGKARLMGVVRSKSQPSRAFAVDVLFEDRVNPLDAAHPPAMSPKLELANAAYLANGGPIDPSVWHYYQLMEGVLIGLDCLEGAILGVEGRGAAFQVGLGANGKSLHPGGSGWLEWLVLEQPHACSPLQQSGNGDINLDLCGECVECVEEAGDHAITLQAFGDDFLFVSGGFFEERLDGTGRLSGIVQNDDDPLSRWEVDIVFDGRVLPLSPSYPPAGSPKKELAASKYIENGGVVDPATWHYYLSTQGRFVGLDHNAGLELEVSRMGPPFQVGVGANGKNTRYGGSGWLSVVEVNSGASSVGDINMDIAACE